MSHASLRTKLVDVYEYVADTTDSESGVTQGRYRRVLSPDAHGQWWASRGTVFGRETAPTGQEQEEETSLWSFSADCPVAPNGVLRFEGEVYRIQTVIDRDIFRDAVQVYATHADDADASFVLEEPT